MKRLFPAALVCLCAALSAEEPFEPAALDTLEQPAFAEWVGKVSLLLGTTLEEAFTGFGVPLSVSSARGAEAWQDDVVFEYGGGFSLFWYKDRVWQVRYGPGFHGEFRDAGMGVSREKITAVLGSPFHAEEDWMLYHVAGQSYPVRLRLFFGDAGLEDIYIYRSDF